MKKEEAYDKIGAKNIDNRIRSFDEMPLFLDVKDVANTLNIGRNSAYYMFNADGFPRIKVAGQYRVRKDDLVDWLKKQRN
jgi:predicted DNA-binding transcriptional regulator AlpA